MAKKIESKAETKTAVTKKTRAKKTASSEVGNVCIHALALYTNATIKERTPDYVMLHIPYTLLVGKKSATFYVEFKVNPAKIDFDVKDKTIDQIGEYMFGFCFDFLRNEPNVLGIDDKPLANVKNYTVVTTYGDKFIWKNGTYKTEKAVATKKAKK